MTAEVQELLLAARQAMTRALVYEKHARACRREAVKHRIAAWKRVAQDRASRGATLEEILAEKELWA